MKIFTDLKLDDVNNVVRIGWWENQPSLKLYHFSDPDQKDRLLDRGITRKDRKIKAIPLYFTPTSNVEGSLITEFTIPLDFVRKYALLPATYNKPNQISRLCESALYERFNGADSEYYQDCELRFTESIPRKFITKLMVR